jgi:hypothetical protein
MINKKGNPIFAEFKEIFESDDDMDLTSPFMANRLMSLTDDFVISIICNQFVGRIPNKLLLLIYRKFVGTKNAPWVRYPKKKPKQEPILLQKICRAFNCNSKHGRQTIELYRRMNIKPESLFGMEKPK